MDITERAGAARSSSLTRTRTRTCALAAPSPLLLLLLLSAAAVQARQGFGHGGQEYGYVSVRPGAHLFYWLYYARGGEQPAGKPLVIWLQGGPGASSSGFGNFQEVGPLDENLNNRTSTWVNHVNVMFIDNPVGTGFSYVDSPTKLTTNNKQIATDLVEFMKQFLKAYPQFRTIPVYIFSESYGGKMAAEFAWSLFKEKAAGEVDVNIRGVVLGDAWISPIDSVMSWAPFLLNTGMVDTKGYKIIMGAAQSVKAAVNSGSWDAATSRWSNTERLIMGLAENVDFYNILTPVSSSSKSRDMARIVSSSNPRDFLFRLMVERISDAELDRMMNAQVKEALGIPEKVTYATSSIKVFNALWQDFMKPVTGIVEKLLSETDLKVVVFNGQLDLIVDTPGTVVWAERLKWKGSDAWARTARKPLTVNNIVEGFVKSHGKFTFYWVNRSGHMVPSDNPAASIEILRQVTEFDK